MSAATYRISKCREVTTLGSEKCAGCQDRFVCFTTPTKLGKVSLKGGYYSFIVPNDDEGQLFIKQARKFLNRGGWGMRIRGRAINRKEAFEVAGRVPPQQHVSEMPPDIADYLVVYLRPKENSIRRMGLNED